MSRMQKDTETKPTELLNNMASKQVCMCVCVGHMCVFGCVPPFEDPAGTMAEREEQNIRHIQNNANTVMPNTICVQLA